MKEDIKVGFTGTRSGMSDKQKDEVKSALFNSEKYNVTHIFHGGCIGADIDFHDMCFGHTKIVVYPGHSAKDPENMENRGEIQGADTVYVSQTHFKRNRDIVDNCDVLFATPYNDNGQGGTWYTINYAKKVGKKVIIFNRI